MALQHVTYKPDSSPARSWVVLDRVPDGLLINVVLFDGVDRYLAWHVKRGDDEQLSAERVCEILNHERSHALEEAGVQK